MPWKGIALITEAELATQSPDELFAGLFGPAGHDDPYPYYRALRAQGPVMRTPFGTLVFGYADCHQILQDRNAIHDVESGAVARGYPDWRERSAFRLTFMSMLMSNPPDHTRLRRLVSKAFTRREVQQLQPAMEQLADAIVARMVDQVRSAPSEPIDLVQACAYEFPVSVVGELLGVPEPDRPRFRELVLTETAIIELLILPGAADKADAAADELIDYFLRFIQERRRRPTDDLTSKLLAVDDEGEKLTDEELVRMLGLIMGAGFETTTNLLANGVVALLAHPKQLADWRVDISKTDAAVQELLRYDGPVQLFPRAMTQDVTLPSGASLSAGERPILMVGAANRDPLRYVEPDVLDLSRPDPRPLSFGGGIHHCLGAPLALAEAAVVLPRLLSAFPEWELAPGVERREGLTIRGYTKLPLHLGLN